VGGEYVNSEQIKQLEKELWDAADNLRANSKLTAAEYKDPVLGLILLRYAQNRYEDAKLAIEPKLIGPRGKRPATQADFLAAGAMMPARCFENTRRFTLKSRSSHISRRTTLLKRFTAS
jgi:type I restriction-modification system DNA methylase subunit